MDIASEILKRIRVGIDILEKKEADGTYYVPDATLLEYIDNAIIFLSTSDIKMSSDVKIVALKYLAQHLFLMAQRETASISLPNNSESWNSRVAGLRLDQTVQGQMFKEIMNKYTDDFESASDLASKPQHFIKIFS